jgi:hypothetical protein
MSDVAMSSAWIDYDYAIIRVVPRVHVCAFTNIGVVLHARQAGVLDARIGFDATEIASRCPGIDTTLLSRYVDAYLSVVRGGPDAAPIGLLPPSERFHWLTAPRSAVLQTSEVHPGKARDLVVEIDRLFREQCLPV